MSTTDWPGLPIRPEDLPKIRELLTAEEYAALLKRLGRRQLGQRKGRTPARNHGSRVAHSNWLAAVLVCSVSKLPNEVRTPAIDKQPNGYPAGTTLARINRREDVATSHSNWDRTMIRRTVPKAAPRILSPTVRVATARQRAGDALANTD